MKKIFLLLLVLVTSSFVFSQEAEEGFDEDSIENVVTTALLKKRQFRMHQLLLQF